MAKFNYTAKDRLGKIEKGSSEAKSKDDLITGRQSHLPGAKGGDGQYDPCA
jgi:type II secretory pathway component PulF